jgi:hypothetical protein
MRRLRGMVEGPEERDGDGEPHEHQPKGEPIKEPRAMAAQATHARDEQRHLQWPHDGTQSVGTGTMPHRQWGLWPHDGTLSATGPCHAVSDWDKGASPSVGSGTKVPHRQWAVGSHCVSHGSGLRMAHSQWGTGTMAHC